MIAKLVFVSVLLAAMLRAQAPQPLSVGVTCRVWQGLSANSRAGYILGIIEGFANGIVLAKATNQRELSERYFALGDVLSPNDYLAGLSQFCADPANVLVSAFDGMEVVSLKARLSTLATLVIVRLRKLKLRIYYALASERDAHQPDNSSP